MTLTLTRQLRDLFPDAELSKVDISCSFRKIPMMGRWIKVTDVGRPLDGRKTRSLYLRGRRKYSKLTFKYIIFVFWINYVCHISKCAFISFNFFYDYHGKAASHVISNNTSKSTKHVKSASSSFLTNEECPTNYYFNKTMIFLLIFTTRLKLQCLKDGRFITIENDVSKVNLSKLQ